ncbi:hypothetical protein ACFL6K_04175 [Candidatus Latescibacterota bacterium]
MKINMSVAVISAVLFLSPQPADADIAPMHRIGKTIRPRTDTSVRMVSETVDIITDGERAYVYCMFELTNDGPPDTLEVGFPLGMNVMKKDNKMSEKFSEGLGIEPSVRCNNGPPLPYTLEPAFTDESEFRVERWMTFIVPFTAKGQTNKIDMTYWLPLQPKYGGKAPISDLLFKYVLVTGAYWKGPIGDAKITVKLRETTFDRITYISPEGYVKGVEEISWHFTDFEPEEDIEINFKQE